MVPRMVNILNSNLKYFDLNSMIEYDGSGIVNSYYDNSDHMNFSQHPIPMMSVSDNRNCVLPIVQIIILVIMTMSLLLIWFCNFQIRFPPF